MAVIGSALVALASRRRALPNRWSLRLLSSPGRNEMVLAHVKPSN